MATATLTGLTDGELAKVVAVGCGGEVAAEVSGRLLAAQGEARRQAEAAAAVRRQCRELAGLVRCYERDLAITVLGHAPPGGGDD